ncbi:MAG: Mth938-like domain-containing protein [Syntrophobacterales bacterium]|nr:Mth938-like domain-containing protein [Syntrophobacterales bacterium]
MIDKYSFGSMVIKGMAYKSDLKILGDRVLPNWWRKEGHRLHEEDIQDVLDYQPEELIIGTGFLGMMKVDEGLKQLIENRGIKIIVERTGKAVSTFNEAFNKGRRVAGAFHLTC